MQGPFLRKYGVQTTINFQLFEVDGVDFRVDAAHAAGDSIIMKDEGAEASTGNAFVDEGNGYSIVLASGEMEAARIVVYLIDQSGTKVWLDTAFVVETYGNASAMHAFDLDTATQSVDVTLVDGTAQRATDLAEIAQYLIANSATLTDIIADDSILAKLLATDGDISAFAEATDSLQSIRDAITDASPQNHAATSSNDTTGTIASGTYADTATDNGTRWQIAPAGAAVGGFGLNVDLVFGIGTGRVPSTVFINGYWNAAAPAGTRTVEVWAYNYLTAAWEQISDSGTNFDDAAADADYQYALSIDHVQVADGEVNIRFTATSTDTDDDLYLDQVLVSSVAQEAAGLTATAISETVWNHTTSGHDEDTMGYVVAHIRILKGDISSATDASQFIIDAGVAVNDAYNGMLIMVEDKTDDHYEVRRIVDYIGATNEVFVDRAFGFTPVADDDYYIMATGYADVNATHIEAVDATDQINTQADTALSDIHLDHLLAADYDPASKPGSATALLNELVEDDGGVSRFTENSLEQAPSGTGASAASIADAVWDEALADHDSEDSMGNVVNDLTEESGGVYRLTSAALAEASGGAGAGAITFTYTLTSSVDALPIADADVWVTTDEAGTNVVASGTTNSSGVVTFYLDAGTVYVWRQKDGWNFTNPDTETVS